MKRLKDERYRGFELHFYDYIIENERMVLAYAYESGKSINKENFSFETKSKNKTYAQRKLQNIIDKNIKPISKTEAIKLLQNHSVFVATQDTINNIENYSPNLKGFIKQGDLIFPNGDDYRWLKNRVKELYSFDIEQIDSKMSNDGSMYMKLKINY